jgi:hypothetical protein
MRHHLTLLQGAPPPLMPRPELSDCRAGRGVERNQSTSHRVLGACYALPHHHVSTQAHTHALTNACYAPHTPPHTPTTQCTHRDTETHTHTYAHIRLSPHAQIEHRARLQRLVRGPTAHSHHRPPPTTHTEGTPTHTARACSVSYVVTTRSKRASLAASLQRLPPWYWGVGWGWGWGAGSGRGRGAGKGRIAGGATGRGGRSGGGGGRLLCDCACRRRLKRKGRQTCRRQKAPPGAAGRNPTGGRRAPSATPHLVHAQHLPLQLGLRLGAPLAHQRHGAHLGRGLGGGREGRAGRGVRRLLAACCGRPLWRAH